MPSYSDIESSFLELMDDLFDIPFDGLSKNTNVRDDVDFAETLHKFLVIRLTQLASDCIWNDHSSNRDYETKFYEEGFRFVSDLTQLCVM